MGRPEAAELIESSRRMLSDLRAAHASYRADPERVRALAFAPLSPQVDVKAIVGPRAGPGADQGGSLLEHLEAGASAVEELATSGDRAVLTAAQEVGLDVMLHFTARPALLLEDWSFTDASPPWDVLLLDAVEPVVEAGQRVGRIQRGGSPHAGTGFLVADGVLMTNCHVARQIADPTTGWELIPAPVPTVSFAPDPGAPGADVRVVTGVIGVHDRLDLALLRIDGDDLPAPLTLASAPPDPPEGRSVYVVGYPARNPRQEEPWLAKLLFGNTYGVKRLQPGAMLAPGVGPPLTERPCSHRTTVADVFHHDASTLGGNSGSCVIDLATHRVVGLHFAGAHRLYNDAVALWPLAGDPLLARAGVQFAGEG